jgi:hypothetical protein
VFSVRAYLAVCPLEACEQLHGRVSSEERVHHALAKSAAASEGAVAVVCEPRCKVLGDTVVVSHPHRAEDVPGGAERRR